MDMILVPEMVIMESLPPSRLQSLKSELKELNF